MSASCKRSEPSPWWAPDAEVRGFFGAILRTTAVLVGLGLVVWGWRQATLRTRRGEPVRVELEALERGEEPPDAYVRIGPHLEVCSRRIVRRLRGSGGPGGETVVTTYTPIVSLKHPYSSGGPLAPFAVVVEAIGKRAAADLPTEDQVEESLVGTLTGPYESYFEGGEERFRATFDGMDPASVRVLALGHAPAPLARAAAALAGGALLVLFGLTGVARLHRTGEVPSSS